MTTKHTPAPWHMVETGFDVYVQRNQSGGFVVFDTDKERAKADARLIAAAPCLLAALERLVGAYERLKPPGYPESDPEKQARDAIAKAKGTV